MQGHRPRPFDPVPWMDHAACRGVEDGPELFVPVGSEGSPAVDAQYATCRRICAVCPARPSCLEYALEHRERFGMWGGLTPDERRIEAARRTRLATHAARRSARIAAARVTADA